MSQLVRAITATDTGKRKIIDDKSFSPLFKDVFSVEERMEDTTSVEMFVAKMYRIGVTIGCQVMVTDSDQLMNQYALPEAIARTKRSVVEAIFGEFRQDLYQIQNAVYDRDFLKARNLLTDFEKKMFEAE